MIVKPLKVRILIIEDDVQRSADAFQRGLRERGHSWSRGDGDEGEAWQSGAVLSSFWT